METAEEQKVTKEAIEEPEEIETGAVAEEDEASQKSDDIIKALRATGHKASYCDDQMIVGVRLNGIKGKRGVHIDVVHVLDWRNSSFSGSILAMQASVLETVNMGLKQVLEEVGYHDMLVRKDKRTTRGKVSFDLLSACDSHSGSMVHETRTVYVVTEDLRPSTDLSWLTENSRVVSIGQFLLARQSDFRSVLPEMNRRVDGDKWEHFKRSNNSFVLGILVLAFGVIGALTLSMVNSTLVGNFIPPLGAMSTGIPIGLVLLGMSFREMSKFLAITENENERISVIGDGERIRKSTEANAETFVRIKDMAVVISPLMKDTGHDLRFNDIKGALKSVSIALDEIVKKSVHHEDIPHEDESLGKFLGIFSKYDPRYNEDQMSESYIALSNYLIFPLDASSTMDYCTVLLNALARIGIVRPEVKGLIDDDMNKCGFIQTLTDADKAVSAPLSTEEIALKEMNKTQEAETSEDESTPKEADEVPHADDTEVTPGEDLDDFVEELVKDTHEGAETLTNTAITPEAVEENDRSLEPPSAKIVAMRSKEREENKDLPTRSIEAFSQKLPVPLKKRRPKCGA
ncbi:MAG: hypothetical protein ACTSV2_03570 [Candidatus Thorarchaeota archaeon]